MKEIKVSIPIDPLPGILDNNSDPTILAIVKRDIPRWAEKYVHYIDTATTQEICKCEWLVNPDDLEIRPLCCRECTHPRDKHVDQGDNRVSCTADIADDECGCVVYTPRRVRMGERNPVCPVHSPVGRIMGFFEFVFKQAESNEGDSGTDSGNIQLDQDEHAGIAEHCYRQECVHWITGSSNYCSIECEQMAIKPRRLLNSPEMTEEEAKKVIAAFAAKYPQIWGHRETPNTGD